MELNFLNIRFIEITPHSLNQTIHWEYKITTLHFKDVNEYIKRVLRGKYKTFMSEVLSNRDLHNMFINSSFYKSATTSSIKMQDMYRAISTELMYDVVASAKINKAENGIVILTGEVPAFFQNKADLILMLIDTLTLKGLWGIYVDEQISFIPFLQHDPEKFVVPLNALISELSIIHVPTFKTQDNSNIVYIGDNKYLGANGDIFRYKVDNYAEDVIVPNRFELKIPKDIKITDVILDLRDRPINYGPHPSNNVVTLKHWLNRLSNIIV